MKGTTFTEYIEKIKIVEKKLVEVSSQRTTLARQRKPFLVSQIKHLKLRAIESAQKGNVIKTTGYIEKDNKSIKFSLVTTNLSRVECVDYIKIQTGCEISNIKHTEVKAGILEFY